jgi:hypothetical protein
MPWLRRGDVKKKKETQRHRDHRGVFYVRTRAKKNGRNDITIRTIKYIKKLKLFFILFIVFIVISFLSFILHALKHKRPLCDLCASVFYFLFFFAPSASSGYAVHIVLIHLNERSQKCKLHV